MLIVFIILILIGVAVYLCLQQPIFGKPPSGQRLEKIRQSRNFRKGQFQNVHHTPSLAEGSTYTQVFKEFFFTKKIRNTPGALLPCKKTDLLSLDVNANVLVWFGHSSYFCRLMANVFW
jgi:hypothetical protein